MAYEFMMPRSTIMGENGLDLGRDKIVAMGKKAMIVTGKVVTRTGLTKRLTDKLEEWNLEYDVFSDITGEPTQEMIALGVEFYHKNACDFIIGIGGGSPLDSAKAIGAFTVLEGEISEYMGKEIVAKMPPLVLIPTTAGTGSEATKFTIITDSQKDVKMLLKGECLLPDLAILDASFTLSMPEGITSATGMDALTHAIEAYTSKKAGPLTDLFALSAIKRIFKYLPVAYEDGSNVKAREEMAYASYEAGLCINNSSVTIVHGMSRPIGALFHVPHGISNAMLLTECLSYILDGAYERFGEIGRALNVATPMDTDQEAAVAFVRELENLCKALEIPTLQEYGIDKVKFENVMEKMASDAIASGSPSNTRKEIKEEDILKIYKKLW